MYKKFTIIVLAVIVLFISITTILNKNTVSYLERRHLASFPKVDLLDPDFYSDLDTYMSDHLLWRDSFIKYSSLANRYLFGFKDNHGVYSSDGYLFETAIEDDDSINDLIAKTNGLKDTYFKDQEVYFIAIPRKNDYTERYFPLDLRYDDIKDSLKDNLDMDYIDISDLLSLDSYYHTDIHWRQDKIEAVADYIVRSLGDEYSEVEGTYKTINDFKGSLYASSFYDVAPDQIDYLTFDETDISVYDLEKDAYVGVYDEGAIGHPDMYDVFLDGPSAYIHIENKKAPSDQKLIIFRDSFASSLIPLMIDSYASIDVIDLRYFNSSLLDTLELDQDAKVLFMYSLEFINKSGALR